MSCFSSLRVAIYQRMVGMPAHAHATPVICLPLGGAYVERTRGRETEHRLGDILVCPADEEHSQLFRCGPVTKLLMVPSDETLAMLGAVVPVAEAPHGRIAGLGALALRLADEIDSIDPQASLIAEGLGLQILGLFARDEQGPMAPAAWLRSARDFVRAHACEIVRLGDVAAHVDRTPSRLAVAYRRAYGCTIGEDARLFRLRQSALLLASTREPIAGIAAQCGYYDQAHLGRHFRKAYGMSPLAYRRRLH